MGMSFIGSYSGIDQKTIDQLMEAERMPLKHLNTKKTNITEKQNAWKDVNTRLNSLFEKMKALQSNSTFNTKLAKSTNENFVSMKVGNGAPEGKYDIQVKQLATSSRITGKQIIANEQIDGKENTKKSLEINGGFKIESSEGKTVDITIKEEDSLQDIAKKINSSMTVETGVKGEADYKAAERLGIKAIVVDDRLVLTDEKTGNRDIKLENIDASNDTLKSIGLEKEKFTMVEGQQVNNLNPSEKGGIFKIAIDGIETDVTIDAGASLEEIKNVINATMNDTGIVASISEDNRLVINDEKPGAREISLSNEKINRDILGDIGLNGVSSSEIEKSNVSIGQDAIFKFNDIEMTKPSNTINGIVEGIVINLDKVHEAGAFDTITVISDAQKTTKLVQDFVDQYNSTMQFIEDKTKAGDPKAPGSKGALAGEGSLVRLQSTLRTLVTGVLSVEGSTITDASQIGISTIDKQGTLHFDSAVFLKALENDKDSVMNFLNPGENAKGEKQIGLIGKVNDYIDGFVSKENGIIKSQNESFERSLKNLTNQMESFEARMVKKEAYYIKTFTALDIAMMKAEDQMGWLKGQVDAMNGGGR